jgi:DNA-binding FadR family transcriptional regulator
MNNIVKADIQIGQTLGETVRVVVDTLTARIHAGDYPTDSRLPSERALAVELGVSRNTLREALDVLETQKMVRRRQGSGSFVIYQSDVPPCPAPSASAPARSTISLSVRSSNPR